MTGHDDNNNADVSELVAMYPSVSKELLLQGFDPAIIDDILEFLKIFGGQMGNMVCIILDMLPSKELSMLIKTSGCDLELVLRKAN